MSETEFNSANGAQIRLLRDYCLVATGWRGWVNIYLRHLGIDIHTQVKAVIVSLLDREIA